MTYKAFILSLPLQDDATINWMIQFVQADKSFPDTKNIETVIKHVYLQFNHKQTLAFQKTLIIYLQESGDMAIMNSINKIVELQNGDERYQY